MSPRSLPRGLLVVLALTALAKLWVVWATRDILLILDEADYVARARFLLEDGYLQDSYRPPLYPVLVAALGASATPVRLLHVLLSTGAAVVLYRWLRPLAGERGAMLSAALFAAYPTFVGFTHLLWTETVFLCLLVALFAVAWPARETGLARCAAAGAIYGLAVLTRSVLLPFLPVAALFVAAAPLRWAWRTAPLLRASVFAAAAVATIAPWTLHNRLVEGEWVLVESNNGYNLWKGNTPDPHPMASSGPRYPGPLVSIPMFPYEGSAGRLRELCSQDLGVPATELRAPRLDRCARDRALAYIASDLPAFVARGMSKLGVAFHPSSLITRHLLLGYYGPVPGAVSAVIYYGTALALLAVLAVGGIAAVRAPRVPLTLGLLAFALYQLAVIFVAFGNTRFRLPVLLVVMVLAAWIPRRPPDHST